MLVSKKIINELKSNKLTNIFPCVIYWKDIHGVYTGCNERAAELAGLLSPQEIIGKNDYELPWSQQAAAILKADKEVILSDRESTIEETKKLADGTEVTFLITRIPLKSVQGTIGVLSVAMNVTQIKNNEMRYVTQQERSYLTHFNDALIGKSAALSYQSAEQHAHAVRYHLEKIIDCMPNNVFWTDRNSVYLGCNGNTAKVLGLRSRDDIVGLTYEDLSKICNWNEGQGESFKRDDQEVMATGKPKLNIEEPPIPDVDGNLIYFLTSRVPLYDEQNKVIGIVAISIDITERKKMEEALREAKRAAEAADRAKTEFLENMRHDIRTPLSGITGLATIIKDNISNRDKVQDLKAYSDNIIASSNAILGLLNEILEYIRVISGEIPLLKKKFNIIEKLQNVIDLNQAKASEKNLKLLLDWDEHVPRFVLGDPTRIHRIVLELVVNALNFTSAGQVEIAIRVAKEYERMVVLKVTVQDTGIGIAAEKIQEVFTRFKRLTPSYEGIQKGAGLGLAVVKQFVDDLEGEIYVESMPQRGTIFTCTFQLQKALLIDEVFDVDYSVIALQKPELSLPVIAEKMAVMISQDPETELTRVLLVEDLDIAATVAKALLSKLGCLVDIVDNGHLAVIYAKKHAYDLIFMDVGLPDISGNEVTQQIREWETLIKAKHVPIIALTAHIDVENKEQCIKAGMDAVLSKPLMKEMAADILNAFIPKRAGSQHKRCKEVVMNGEEEEGRLFELPTVIIELDAAIKSLGGKKFAKDMIKMFIESLPEVVENLQSAYTKKDWNAIQAIAHKLLGGASYCATHRLRAACSHLEEYLRNGKIELRSRLYSQLLHEIAEVRLIAIKSPQFV